MIENPQDQNIKACCILFNLGGPDSIKEVERFLFNLFFDKRIITMPLIPRFLLAKLISKLRKKKAEHIYSLIGGKSPIKENTTDQAIALQNYLQSQCNNIAEKSVNWRVFFAMRHSSPQIKDIIPRISEFDAKYVLLLPLYPQFSTTTTQSFFDEWNKQTQNFQNASQIIRINDYHSNKLFISACAEMITGYIKSNIANTSNLRLLFSAHGLPEVIIKNGDPYKEQIEKCYHLICAKINDEIPELDTRLCYQSRVGLQKWIRPSLDEEVQNAAKDGKNIAIFPISFTNEHSETLVELDIETKENAHALGIKEYYRIPTLGANEKFISCLGEMLRQSLMELI